MTAHVPRTSSVSLLESGPNIGLCNVCHRYFRINNNGCLRRHNNNAVVCSGSGSVMKREKTKLNATTVPLPAMTQVPPPPPSIRQSAPDPTASTPTLAACDLSDTLPSLEQIGKAKVTTLSHVPKALRTIWADILAESCNRILREPENLDAWRKWLMLPKSSLISPPQPHGEIR